MNSIDRIIPRNLPTMEGQDKSRAEIAVQRFLPLREQEGLNVWSEDFFLYQLARMYDDAEEKG